AVAAALFASVPVYATEDVLNDAGIDLNEGDIAAELNIETPETQPEITEESVDEFREFLKDLSPEDFLASGEPNGEQRSSPPVEDGDTEADVDDEDPDSEK